MRILAHYSRPASHLGTMSPFRLQGVPRVEDKRDNQPHFLQAGSTLVARLGHVGHLRSGPRGQDHVTRALEVAARVYARVRMSCHDAFASGLCFPLLNLVPAECHLIYLAVLSTQPTHTVPRLLKLQRGRGWSPVDVVLYCRSQSTAQSRGR